MNVGIFGTGNVGQTIAARFAALGHNVVIGTRDPDATMARTEPDRMGSPPYRTWQAAHPAVRLATFADTASSGEILVNASSGEATLQVLEAAGEDNLNGKILIDVANPLDLSQGFPPSLSVVNTDSLGEQIQRRFPSTKVVKTLNTMNCTLMMQPEQLAGADHTVFVSGDDTDAKATVGDWLRTIGWTDIVDLGDITTARGTEMLIPLWIRLFGQLQTPAFQFKVVR